VATSQRFVSRKAVVKSVRLNSKPIARSSLEYQGKKSTNEVSLKQPEEDQLEVELQSPLIGKNSTTS
jgi:hypothetical protein